MGHTPHSSPVETLLPEDGYQTHTSLTLWSSTNMSNTPTTMKGDIYRSLCHSEATHDIENGASFLESVGCLLFSLIFILVTGTTAALSLYYCNHVRNKKQEAVPVIFEEQDENVHVPSDH